ncbi:MAG TPA: PIN domain-containing protein [Candidatus Limnocylindrales bacterium]|jgi:predicted nucleic acid-binding protein|nr:PIN domain-containing protein [Candidatus Limnocylindrales bacterium]
MKDKFFLDTNIFVYSFDTREPAKAKVAGQLIEDGIATRKGTVSYQVVQEFFNVALSKFRKPMTVAECEQYLRVIFRPLLVVHPSETLLSDALYLRERAGLSWYDSLIVGAAQQSDCKVLFTEDMQHGQVFDELRIVNPFR